MSRKSEGRIPNLERRPKSENQRIPVKNLVFRIRPSRAFGLSRLGFQILRRFASPPLALMASLFLCHAQRPADVRSSPPLDRVEAEKQGRALAAQLRDQKPGENSVSTGWLKIRDERGKVREIPARFEIFVTPTNWVSIYETTASSNGPGGVKLTVVCTDNRPNHYVLAQPAESSRLRERIFGWQI